MRRVTIGFDAVATLAAGKLDAATAFWNAEGVALRGLGVPTREFRVDDYGAPRYPELVLATVGRDAARRPAARRRGARRHGPRLRRIIADHGDEALGPLLDAVPDLDPDEQARAVRGADRGRDAFAGSGDLDRAVLAAWARWDLEHGILSQPARRRRGVSAARAGVGDDA